MQAVHWYSLLTKSLGEDCLGQPLRPLPAGSPLRAWHASDAGLDSLSWPFPPGIVERLPAKQHGVLALWFDGVWRFCPQSDVDPRPTLTHVGPRTWELCGLEFEISSRLHSPPANADDNNQGFASVSPGSATETLLENMRMDQNNALDGERRKVVRIKSDPAGHQYIVGCMRRQVPIQKNFQQQSVRTAPAFEMFFRKTVSLPPR